jgi:hypothetical protein
MIKISIVLATTAVLAALLIAYPFSPSSSGSRHHAHKPTVTHTASPHRKPGVPRRTPAAAAIADADREAASRGIKPNS